MTPARPVIAQPDTGRDLHAFGNVLSVLLAGEQTGGTLTAMFDLTPVGGGSPLHVHTREDELFLPVDGRISFFVAGLWTEVEPGGLVYLPRGNLHGHRNVGITPSHHWILCTPAGLERFFERCAEEFARVGGPDERSMDELRRDYGLAVVGEGPSDGKRRREN